MLTIRHRQARLKHLFVFEKLLQLHSSRNILQNSIAANPAMSSGSHGITADQQQQGQGDSTKQSQQQPESVAASSNRCGRPHRRLLAAFDFDYTVVAQNTDTVVRDLLLPQKLTKDLSQLIDTAGWTEYMARIFGLLHENRVTPTKLRDTIRAIPEVPGFVRLIKRLRQCHDFELIIISDSNSVFIAEWLQAHGVADCFAAVFTNPAHFNGDGLLCIQPYHHQTECRLSAPNLCKGKVLEHYVMEQNLRRNVRFERVIYVGDGNNDICPVLRLRNTDIACARRGFAMEKNLAKNRDKMRPRAQLMHWQNGFDLLEQLEATLQLEKPHEKKDT